MTPLTRALARFLVLAQLTAAPFAAQAGDEEGAPAEASHTDHGALPGPRSPVGPWDGFLTVSRLDWTAAKNQDDFPPTLFEAVYVFPDRVRWLFVPQGEAQSERRLVYRNGGEAFVIEPGSRASKRVEGPERDGVFLQAEARRALMTYPHGFPWSEAKDGHRVADVSERSCCPGEILGRLDLELDGKERPLRLTVRNAAGKLLDTLAVEEWQVIEGRLVPRVMVLHQAGEQVWRETVGSVQLTFDRLDLFFTPSDRRGQAGQLIRDRYVKSLDLRAITYRASDLPGGSDWAQARERFGMLLEAARKELEGRGLALDPVPTFELSESGAPLRVVLRLANYLPTAPEGWSSRSERAGQATLVEGTDEVTGMLELMRARVPAGTRAGSPYARLYDTAQGLRVELGFPLVPRR